MLRQFNTLSVDLMSRACRFSIHPINRLSYQSVLNPEFSKIEDVYKYAEFKLIQEGVIRPDRHGLLRVELNDKFYCSLEWTENIFEDIKKFLEMQGIDYIKIEETEFYNQVKDRLNQYASDFAHIIGLSDIQVYSNILPFYDVKYVGFGSTQLGWIYSYLRIVKKENNK